jgi:hypothetical protein
MQPPSDLRSLSGREGEGSSEGRFPYLLVESLYEAGREWNLALHGLRKYRLGGQAWEHGNEVHEVNFKANAVCPRAWSVLKNDIGEDG